MINYCSMFKEGVWIEDLSAEGEDILVMQVNKS